MSSFDDSGVSVPIVGQDKTSNGEHAPEKTTMTQCNAKPGKLPEGLDLPPPETEDIELQSADVEFTKDRTENQESSSDTSGDHGSLDEEVDEGNLSDGTSIDQYMEFWRAKHEHMELRTKSAPKRVKQIAQYTNILEERVQLLEESATLFDRKLRRITGGVDTLPSPPPEPEDNLLHLKPELNFQLSKGLKNPVPPPGETVAPPTHQIDVFVGEPEAQKAEKFRRGRKIESRSFDDDGMDEQEIPFDPKSDRASKSSDERRLAEEMAKVKSKHFPNRIRFNLTAMVYLFRKYLSTENGTLDNVVLRPFKPLLQNKEDLLNIMSEVVSALARIVSQRTNANTESTKDSSDSEAQGESGETYQPHGVLNITNTASLENHRKSDEITSAPDAITTEEWDIVLKELEFFDEDNGCCGQNMKGWSTVSSVEKSFECFKNLLDNYLLPGHREFRERRAKKIRFCDLWHLFHTGDLVVTKRLAGADETETQAQLGMRVLMTAGGRRVIMPKLPAPALQSSLNLSSSEDKIEPINGVNPFCIHAYYLDYNGSRLVPVRQRILIAPYSGERNISDLEIVPVDYVRGATDMLEERGRRFIDSVTALTAPYVDCKGLELSTREELNDKVIVDMKGYFNTNPSDIPSFQEPEELDVSETSDCYQGKDCSYACFSCYHRTAIVHDQMSDLAAYQEYVDDKPVFNPLSGTPNAGPIEPSDFAICHYRVFAYKLRAREWVQVNVKDLETPRETEKGRGFEKLVLVGDHKHILESQVREHFRKKGSQGTTGISENDMDLVRGKGQGLIILLHGAPGVGKTCTAECIADLVEKPLYPITCGDLGSSADDVERNLKKHFTLASRWDCVMLLDEADFFLAQRKLEDLQRNSIVSVFLRMLEYYKGLLFLTTNRVGTFDEAFTSRVHISLFYPNFDKKTTLKVWKTFIDQTRYMLEGNGRKNVTVDAGEIEEFARKHWKENKQARWNGRQIRNAFHTAVAMAEFGARNQKTDTGYDDYKDVKIKVGRAEFEKIANTAKEFDAYMTETMNGTYDFKASREGWRKEQKEQKEKEKAKKKKKKLSKSKKQSDSSSSSQSDEDDDSDSE